MARPGTALALVAVLAVVAAAAARGDEPPAARKAELLHMLRHDCGSCHGLTRKGGLGAPLLPETIAERSDDHLVAVILDGLPGTPMARWRPLLTDGDAAYLVELLRKGPTP